MSCSRGAGGARRSGPRATWRGRRSRCRRARPRPPAGCRVRSGASRFGPRGRWCIQGSGARGGRSARSAAVDQAHAAPLWVGGPTWRGDRCVPRCTPREGVRSSGGTVAARPRSSRSMVAGQPPRLRAGINRGHVGLASVHRTSRNCGCAACRRRARFQSWQRGRSRIHRASR